jgi:hypothetical protein
MLMKEDVKADVHSEEFRMGGGRDSQKEREKEEEECKERTVGW